MAGLNMTIKHQTRLWVVNDEVGYFQVWEHYSKPLPASPMVGGQPAGVYSHVFGIVEFKDGVRRVDPTDITFHDEENSFLSTIDADTDGKRRIIEGRKT